jgi:hypothetical protein
LLLTGGCGDAGPYPGEVAFWRIAEARLEFTRCSDSPALRGGLEPLPVDSYLIYEVAEDARTARMMSCQTRDPFTCAPHPAGVTFQIAGEELWFDDATTQPMGPDGCVLTQTEAWLVVDLGATAQLEVSTFLSLDGPKSACDAVDAEFRGPSLNGEGIDGCAVRNFATAELN